MWFRLVTVVILLALASRADGRPRDPDPLDGSRQEPTVAATLDTRIEQNRDMQDIQSMDQSLRTVATQLLNATAHREDLVRIPEAKIVPIETPIHTVHVSTKIEDAVGELSSDVDSNSSKMKFGIPVNSKFGHFEISNPGHAMAMTDEEIEREMAAATTIAQKGQPTPASMLSTWIQLYPPASTTEGNEALDTKPEIQSNQIPTTTTTESSLSTVRKSNPSTKPIRKTETKQTTIIFEKNTEPPVTSTKITKNPSTTTISNHVKISSTSATTSESTTYEEIKSSQTRKPQTHRTTIPVSSTTKPTSNKKPVSKDSTTPKPKTTTPKSSTTKPPKAQSPSHKVKPFVTRRPSPNKNDTITGTSKIEKVTLKPISSLPPNRTDSTDRPHFITKVKAPVFIDAQRTTTANPTTMKVPHNILLKHNFTSTESPISRTPVPTKVNNIFKVHKKPIDDTANIEIQPIRVNPPVLTIQKIEDNSSDQKPEKDEILENTKIDVKFHFNPEVRVKTTSPESFLNSASSTTTKRPRTKRKKNKNRRRKPTTTSLVMSGFSATGSATTISTTSVSDMTKQEGLNLADELQLTEYQESKIEPESKVSPSKKKKNHQNSQVQKPIGTQIYNFLSREVMPSVGVMSLVGLGLGLASYFLYPFGGVIARRNYDVEPNYKYNLDEYGGNYGLSEEEVLTKVYSGMTGGQHHETKYNHVVTGEKNPNYYRYSGLEQPQPKPQPTTRYPTIVAKNQGNRVIYRPVETTAYDSSYRKTDFKYPEVPTTPNYYERQRQQQQPQPQQQQQQQQHQPTDFMTAVGKTGMSNRQFVVGNVPKEYSIAEADKAAEAVTSMQDNVVTKLQYQVEDSYSIGSAQASPLMDQAPEDSYSIGNAQALPLTAQAPEMLRNPAALVSKVDEEQPGASYEVEISPSAVAVEHGPRSLKFNHDGAVSTRRKRSILPDITGKLLPLIPRLSPKRTERSSVIQVIPSKSELEKEKKEQEQEEDLSNEILDIIDEALPGKHANNSKKRHDDQHHPKETMNSVHKSTTEKSARSTSTTPTTTTTTTSKIEKKSDSTTTSTTTTTAIPTDEDDISILDSEPTTLDASDNVFTTAKPPEQHGFDVISIAKRVFNVKFRLGLTLLKHASEGLAKYLGQMQKRINGEQQ